MNKPLPPWTLPVCEALPEAYASMVGRDLLLFWEDERMQIRPLEGKYRATLHERGGMQVGQSGFEPTPIAAIRSAYLDEMQAATKAAADLIDLAAKRASRAAALRDEP